MSFPVPLWAWAAVSVLTTSCAQPAQLGGLGVFNPRGFEGRMALAGRLHAAPASPERSRAPNASETATAPAGSDAAAATSGEAARTTDAVATGISHAVPVPAGAETATVSVLGKKTTVPTVSDGAAAPSGDAAHTRSVAATGSSDAVPVGSDVAALPSGEVVPVSDHRASDAETVGAR